MTNRREHPLSSDPFMLLSHLATWLSKKRGVCPGDAGNGIVIEVTTEHSVYTMAVINPKECLVAVQGNNHAFHAPTIARLNGSTFGGCILYVGRILPKMFLEFSYPDTLYIETTSLVLRVERYCDPALETRLLDEARKRLPEVLPT